jgi:protein TonB
MFAQTFVSATVPVRRTWQTLLSMSLQMTLLTLWIVLQVANPDLLPHTALRSWLASPLPPQPPAPDPLRNVSAAPHRPTVPTQLRDGKLVFPVHPPNRVVEIDDPDIQAMPIGASACKEHCVLGATPTTLAWTEPNVAPKPPEAVAPRAAVHEAPTRILVVSNIQQGLALYQPLPLYPQIAKSARIAGTVRFTAIIARDGSIQNLMLISGHPLLVGAAQEAVRQWRYRPTLLNGEPVEVQTVIDVNFTLNR